MSDPILTQSKGENLEVTIDRSTANAIDGKFGIGGFGGMPEQQDLITATWPLPAIRSRAVTDLASLKLAKRIPHHIAPDMHCSSDDHSKDTRACPDKRHFVEGEVASQANA